MTTLEEFLNEAISGRNRKNHRTYEDPSDITDRITLIELTDLLDSIGYKVADKELSMFGTHSKVYRIRSVEATTRVLIQNGVKGKKKRYFRVTFMSSDNSFVDVYEVVEDRGTADSHKSGIDKLIDYLEK